MYWITDLTYNSSDWLIQGTLNYISLPFDFHNPSNSLGVVIIEVNNKSIDAWTRNIVVNVGETVNISVSDLEKIGRICFKNMNGWGGASGIAKVKELFPTSLSLQKLPTNTNLSKTAKAIENIPNILIYLQENLRSNLIGKGVEVAPTDKMSSLINKISEVVKSPFPSWATIEGIQQNAVFDGDSSNRFGYRASHGDYIFCTNISGDSYAFSLYDIKTNTYAKKANSLTSAIHHEKSCIIDNYFYYISGLDFYKYNIITDTHETITSKPHIGSMTTIGRAKDKIIFKDGDGHGGYIYNIVTSTYVYKSFIAYEVVYYGYCMTVGNKVYVCYTIRNSRFIKVCEFNMETETTTLLNSIDFGETNFGTMKVFHDDTNIYMIWRFDTYSNGDRVLKYNTKNNTFEKIKFDMTFGEQPAKIDTLVLKDNIIFVSGSNAHRLIYLKEIFN